MGEYQEQWNGFVHAYETGRLAHAYILVGDPRGVGKRFVEDVLHLLYRVDRDSPETERIMQGAHPDVTWLEPQSKSRQINIDSIRELNRRIQQTATQGAWKVGVILAADRMNEQAANAFLKSLEEPAGQTLLLLVTDAEQSLLPTITSRCHRIVISYQEPDAEGEWREPLLEILRAYGGQDPLQIFEQSEALAALLKDLKSQIEKSMKADYDKEEDDEDIFAARVSAVLKEQQLGMLKCMLWWQRDLLYCVVGSDAPAQLRFPAEVDVLRQQAGQLSHEICMRRIRAVEDIARRLERHMPPAVVFEAGLAAQLGKRRTA